LLGFVVMVVVRVFHLSLADRTASALLVHTERYASLTKLSLFLSVPVWVLCEPVFGVFVATGLASVAAPFAVSSQLPVGRFLGVTTFELSVH